MKYVMVTDLKGHWDNMRTRWGNPTNSTSYPQHMLRSGLTPNNLQNGTPTILINIHTGQAWEGYIDKISLKNQKIHFQVHISQQLPQIPPQYASWTNGWYADPPLSTSSSAAYIPTSGVHPTVEQILDVISQHEVSLRYLPLFISRLRHTQNWREFEELSHLLLRLLGIHTLCAFSSNEQKGHSDGFFKIGKLAVIYDITLDQNYQQTKAQQIQNFLAQIEKDPIECCSQTISLVGCYRQVWILTRGTTQVVKQHASQVGQIVVKEVSIECLVKTYIERMENLCMNEDELADRLRHL